MGKEEFSSKGISRNLVSGDARPTECGSLGIQPVLGGLQAELTPPIPKFLLLPLR
jgi:hypothetical protein